MYTYAVTNFFVELLKGNDYFTFTFIHSFVKLTVYSMEYAMEAINKQECSWNTVDLSTFIVKSLLSHSILVFSILLH